MFDYKNFVAQIVKLRKRAGYSQSDIAKQFGYTRQAVQVFERNERIPKLDTIAKYSEVLDFDVVIVPGSASGEYIKADDLIRFIVDAIGAPERDKILQFIEENKHKF